MRKRLVLMMILALVVVSMTAAANSGWYYNKEISEFSYSGVKNISESDINNVLYPYRYKEFTDDLFAEIQDKLYRIDGVDFFTADAEQIPETGELRIVFEFYEIPKLTAIRFDGNEKLKTKDLKEGLTSISAGTFLDPMNRAVLSSAVSEIQDLYRAKGMQDVPVEYNIEENAENNTFEITFSVNEGKQTRIVGFFFEGNEKIDSATLKKQVKSKTKSLFNNGYLDMNQIRTDANNIAIYYQTNGYIDVIVSEPVIETIQSSNEKYEEVTVTFKVVEGPQWFYGGMEVSGNTIFTDEQIKAVQSMKVGSVLNLESVQSEYTAVADLYYNDGYISNGMNIVDVRDDTDMTVKFFLTIQEGSQAVVQEILLSGLEKTKDYVMRRELAIKPGDVFSKAKMVSSAQNLYNTGYLSDLDYNLSYGQDENNVILDFKLTEGSTKNIQFGATFGGTLNGFPVSGFVQWADLNLGGRGQSLNISSTISPDTQSISFGFGDGWFKQYRWANSFNFGFTHTKSTGELQIGLGAKEYYDGRNEKKTWPLGYSDADQWIHSNNEYPASKDLMDYDLFTYSLGYSTGYTFMFDAGRLTLSGNASVSLNKAFYDETKFHPFEKLIYQYGQKWQFSNKIGIGIQWDGRDFINAPTKGYVLGASMTYAGGLLGGLSNYVKMSANAAGYVKLFSFVNSEEETKNIMLCVSTSGNVMLPQLYNYEKKGLRFWDPKLGATKYEMLYIDGMTIGRGFGTVVDQAFLWDNMAEISYQLVENILQAELFVSATGVNSKLTDIKNGINWYYAAGFGIKLKIQGFPLGLYLVKNATYRYQNFGDTARSFEWLGGSYFHGSKETSGMSLVLAISTSLI